MEKPELNWWFEQLAAINESQRTVARNKERTPPNRLSGRLYLELVVLPFGIALSLAVAVWLGAARWLASVSLWALAICYAGIFLYPIIALWIHRQSAWQMIRNPFSMLLENAEVTAQVDRPYLGVFVEQPLKSIQFVLMELRSEKLFFERRLALVVGSIEKVGILPGVLAFAVVLSRLGDDQPGWVYAVAYAMPVLYVFGALSHFLLMRLDRMIQLLEMVADWKESSNQAIQPTPPSGAADG